MKISTFFAAAALSLSTAGCVSVTADIPALTDTSAVAFTELATVSNTFEIESSRLALERSRDRDVRRFAREMIRDHQAATARLQQVSARAGLPVLRPQLDPAHRRMLADLAAAPPRAFDQRYIEMQAIAHDEAIALFSSYARRGDEPRLQAFAARTLPILEEHARDVADLEAYVAVAGRY